MNKQEWREHMWEAMSAAKVVGFPGANWDDLDDDKIADIPLLASWTR